MCGFRQTFPEETLPLPGKDMFKRERHIILRDQRIGFRCFPQCRAKFLHVSRHRIGEPNETGGGFRYIRIYGRRIQPNGKFAPEEEVMIGSLVAAPDHADIPVATLGFAYVRAECETATHKFALTSAARIQ